MKDPHLAPTTLSGTVSAETQTPPVETAKENSLFPLLANLADSKTFEDPQFDNLLLQLTPENLIEENIQYITSQVRNILKQIKHDNPANTNILLFLNKVLLLIDTENYRLAEEIACDLNDNKDAINVILENIDKGNSNRLPFSFLGNIFKYYHHKNLAKYILKKFGPKISEAILSSPTINNDELWFLAKIIDLAQGNDGSKDILKRVIEILSKDDYKILSNILTNASSNENDTAFYFLTNICSLLPNEDSSNSFIRVVLTKSESLLPKTPSNDKKEIKTANDEEFQEKVEDFRDQITGILESANQLQNLQLSSIKSSTKVDGQPSSPNLSSSINGTSETSTISQIPAATTLIDGPDLNKISITKLEGLNKNQIIHEFPDGMMAGGFSGNYQAQMHAGVSGAAGGVSTAIQKHAEHFSGKDTKWHKPKSNTEINRDGFYLKNPTPIGSSVLLPYDGLFISSTNIPCLTIHSMGTLCVDKCWKYNPTTRSSELVSQEFGNLQEQNPALKDMTSEEWGEMTSIEKLTCIVNKTIEYIDPQTKRKLLRDQTEEIFNEIPQDRKNMLLKQIKNSLVNGVLSGVNSNEMDEINDELYANLLKLWINSHVMMFEDVIAQAKENPSKSKIDFVFSPLNGPQFGWGGPEFGILSKSIALAYSQDKTMKAHFNLQIVDFQPLPKGYSLKFNETNESSGGHTTSSPKSLEFADYVEINTERGRYEAYGQPLRAPLFKIPSNWICISNTNPIQYLNIETQIKTTFFDEVYGSIPAPATPKKSAIRSFFSKLKSNITKPILKVRVRFGNEKAKNALMDIYITNMNSSENSYKDACRFFAKNFNKNKDSDKYYSFLWKILNANITPLNGQKKLAILKGQNIVNDSTKNDIKKLLLLNPFPGNKELYEAI